MKKTVWVVVALVLLGGLVWAQRHNSGSSQATGPIRIGYISDLTGPAWKYGAYEAGKLAMEEINAAGGIQGRPLELIFEDGKCNGKEAINAMNKLINVDKVKIVLGGHCSPESAAIAPVAEQNKVIMLATISSTPALTGIGEYVFRTTSVSTAQSKLIADLASSKLGLKNFAIIFEQTDYARPIAEKLKSEFEGLGGKVSVYEGYTPGTSDFRTVLTKVKTSGADAIFLAPQSPDAALYLIQQIKDLGITAKLFGNDVQVNQVSIDKAREAYEGLIAGVPEFHPETNPKTKAFIEAYKAKYNVPSIPYGIWTAEAYDAVHIIAKGIEKHGEDVEELKSYLEGIKGYEGASGTITIDSNHDGVRAYKVMVVKNGKIEEYK